MAQATPTTWLSEDEMNTWLMLVRLVRTLPASLDSQLRADAGMSMFDYLTLAMLSQAPERSLTCSDLAQQVDCSLSRLSHTLDRFARLGWVERHHDGADRRVTFARLTDAGMDVVRQAAPAHVQSVRRLVFNQLSPRDVKDLGRLCTQISQVTSAR